MQTKAKLDLLGVVLKRLLAVVRDHATLMEFIKELILKHSKEKDVIEKKVEASEKKTEEIIEKVEKIDERTTISTKLVNDFSEKVNVIKEEMRTNTEKVTVTDFNLNQLEDKVKKLEDENVKIREEKVEMIKAKKELDKEVDETRQRGLKGNIILSSPNSEANSTLLKPWTSASGSRETDLDMCIRLIRLKTTVTLRKEDVVACHRLGDIGKAKYSYVVRVNNRTNDSAWDILANGMVTGKIGRGQEGVNFDRNVNVYLNFQLTKPRMAIAHQCRMLLKDRVNKPIGKYSVNQNGRITVRKVAGQGQWIEVKDMEELAQISGRQLPILQQQARV